MGKVEAAREKIRQLQEEQSKYIVKDELDLILSRNGASGVNASTGADFTTYYTALPSNRLEMYFWLESDRMKNPVMREFYSERDVVMEERRQRTDNSASGLLYEAFNNAAFQAHPYGRPVIGWASEISSVTRPMAEAFRAKYYGPKSAVLAIVGDVDPNEVKVLADKYFADWDAPGQPKRLVTREPEQRGERRVRVEFDAEPSLMIGWHKPSSVTTDDAAFSWLSYILTSGANSRLYKELVTDKKLVTGIGAYSAPGDKYDNMFVISASPRAPHTVAEVEAAILEVITKLANEGVTEKEMARVRRSFERAYIEQADSNMGFADTLAESANLYKDPYALDQEKERLLSITAEQVQAVAKKYIRNENQTVAWVERPAADQEVAK
jgi:predicted Zn-dependent peptidase